MRSRAKRTTISNILQFNIYRMHVVSRSIFAVIASKQWSRAKTNVAVVMLLPVPIVAMMRMMMMMIAAQASIVTCVAKIGHRKKLQHKQKQKKFKERTKEATKVNIYSSDAAARRANWSFVMIVKHCLVLVSP
jgi:hypothetical protein